MDEPRAGNATDVTSLVQHYRDLVVKAHHFRDQPKMANRLFDERHEVAKTLRVFEAGRNAIESLFGDELAAVRLSAASDSLWWDSAEGVRVLEELERAWKGLDAVTAKYTLREYRAGRLNLDW